MAVTSLCSILLFLSLSSTIFADFADLRVTLNSTDVESRSSNSSNFTDTSGSFGVAFLRVNFTSPYSAQVNFALKFNNVSNVGEVAIYQGGMYVSAGFQPVVNLSSRFSSLAELSLTKSANLSFTVDREGVFPFDAIYARPTDYFLMISNSDGDGIRGQFEDNNPNFFPDGHSDVSSEDVLSTLLAVQDPPPQLQGVNYLDGTVVLEFVELRGGLYNVEFFITSLANGTTFVEIYNIKSNKTILDFLPYVRLPSLNHNTYYRGRISSMSSSSARALLSSPTSYGFRMITSAEGVSVTLSGKLNSAANQTPPPPSPIPSPPPPVSVDPGAEVGVPGVSSAPNLHLTFRKLLVFGLTLLSFLALSLG